MDETNNLLPATEPPQPRSQPLPGDRTLLIALVAAVLLGGAGAWPPTW